MTVAPCGARRTENVFRSRLWSPQLRRVANSERGLTETTRAGKRSWGRACGQTLTLPPTGNVESRSSGTSTRRYGVPTCSVRIGCPASTHSPSRWCRVRTTPAAGDDERALVLEELDLVGADGERLVLRLELILLGLERADAGLGRFAAVLQGLEIRRRRDAFADEPREALLVAHDLRELRLRFFDVLAARQLARLQLRALALEVGRVLGEAGLLDARHEISRGDGLAFIGDARHDAAGAREREVERLIFRDREEPHARAAVVFLAHEGAVTPSARHGDRNRHPDPGHPFH